MDVPKGICWHFLDVPSGVPFLPQEEGSFDNIFQVLFPEVAALTHSPPEGEHQQLCRKQANPKKQSPGDLPATSRHEVFAF